MTRDSGADEVPVDHSRFVKVVRARDDGGPGDGGRVVCRPVYWSSRSVRILEDDLVYG